MQNLISWVISLLVSTITIIKASLEVKKFVDAKVMPDIKTGDTAKEIQAKQDLAKSLVLLAGIEAAYNIGKGIIVALQTAVLAHFIVKLTSIFGRSLNDK